MRQRAGLAPNATARRSCTRCDSAQVLHQMRQRAGLAPDATARRSCTRCDSAQVLHQMRQRAGLAPDATARRSCTRCDSAQVLHQMRQRAGLAPDATARRSCTRCDSAQVLHQMRQRAGLAPTYLLALLSPYCRTRSLRSSDQLRLKQLTYLTKIGERSFSYAAPRAWNQLYPLQCANERVLTSLRLHSRLIFSQNTILTIDDRN